MELRKRTRTSTAKARENKEAEAAVPSPRKTRKGRRPAASSSEEVNGTNVEKQMEANNESSNSQGQRGLGVGENCDTGPVLNDVVAGGHEATEDSPPVNEQVDETENASKRRKFGTSTSIAAGNETQEISGEQINEAKQEIADSSRTQGDQGVEEITKGDGEGKVIKEDDGNADLSLGGDNRSTEALQAGSASIFRTGIDLPIQAHKRKDIHTGFCADTEYEAVSTELVPKRPRRSSNEDVKANDSSSNQGSPSKRATRGKGKASEGSLSKLEVAAPATPAPSTRRRTRLSYKEQSDEEDDYNEHGRYLASHSTPPPKASTSKCDKTKDKAKAATKQEAVEKPTVRGRRVRGDLWDKELLLTSKKSKLATAADLSAALNSATWDLLSPEEQKECLDLLPTIDKVYGPLDSTDPIANPNGEAMLAPDFFEFNQVFKDSLLEFQDDLAQGRYEPSYIIEAANARKARLEGAVDKYKDGQFELFWGQRQHSGMVAGAAAAIKLPELIQKGLLREGDIWSYRRSIFSITIEKEVKVASVTKEGPNYSLVFHIPPGKHKFSHPSRTDIVLEGVISPQSVENVILKIHPDSPERAPNGNAFKVFNIWRKGEDLGLLWEIRQVYWGGE